MQLSGRLDTRTRSVHASCRNQMWTPSVTADELINRLWVAANLSGLSRLISNLSY